MSSQHQSQTPQPTPSHIHNYSQVTDEELVREREHKAECKANHEEAKWQKAEEEKLEVEWRKRAEEEAQRRRVAEEEEAQRKKVAEEEVERQRQQASEERAQARWEEAAQRLCGMVYDINTAKRVPGTSVVVTATRWPPCVGVHMWWAEWEWEQQLQAMERQAEVHEITALAFERMAEAAEWMAEVAEQTANEWELYHAWAEWAEMRRREDTCEARLAEFKHTGGGWKRLQSEMVEDKDEEVDEGAEGDNKGEEEVSREQEGREGQEDGGEQAMEE
ncbi:hypothetical protein M404DRAFT_34838 [Pisolithus tinctorius Marx 270]|uniref:Uncharacterized protein n=1 Tax=Pisolithus tinctorius Marx 270 TaxID=870435 RepID=A0A0C3N0L4_PISTI|nr:hypothetical protein M404DRAFT_34838 [Pisolithus tinctorius Marx 270]